MTSYPPPNPPYVGPAAHVMHNPDGTPWTNNLPATRVVIHATVSPCQNGGARAIGAYFRSQASGGSAHYVVDPGEAVQVVWDKEVAEHAPPNLHSFGVELCDPQAGPATRWQDTNHQAMLQRAAVLVAQLCTAYNIPAVRINSADLLAGKHGICGHADVSAAWHQTDHTDPGDGFPWGAFMGMVQAEVQKIKNPPAPAPQPAPKPPAPAVHPRNVGAMNERAVPDPSHPSTIPLARVKMDTDKFTRRVSIGGIQEWPADRDGILNDLEWFDSTRNPAHKLPGSPIVWRKNRYRYMSGVSLVGAKGRTVGKIPGRRSVLPDYTYTKVVLEDTWAAGSQNRDVVVFNVHFPAHWQFWTGGRRAMARDYENTVAADVKCYVDTHDVYVIGDTNWGYLKAVVAKIAPQRVMSRVGLVACWRGWKVKGTLGSRTVDMIWHQNPATAQPFTLKTASDHLAVVATY